MSGRMLCAAIALIVTVPMPATAAPDRDPTDQAFLLKHYPKRALAAGEQGPVGFRVTLDAKATVISCEITKSSGHARLDGETCPLIVRYARFTPARDAGGDAVRTVRDGVVNWRLPANRRAHAQVRPAAVAIDPHKIICRREVRTGSLVATNRRCMTRREWALAASNARREAESMTEHNSHWDGRVSPN